MLRGYNVLYQNIINPSEFLFTVKGPAGPQIRQKFTVNKQISILIASQID